MHLLCGLLLALAVNGANEADTKVSSAEKKAAEQIRRYDANRDNLVTYQEFVRVFLSDNPNVPSNMTDAFARTAFSRVDANGDGKLDKLEFAIFIAKNN